MPPALFMAISAGLKTLLIDSGQTPAPSSNAQTTSNGEQTMDQSENKPSNPRADTATDINELIEIRLSRRSLLGATLAAGGVAAVGGLAALSGSAIARSEVPAFTPSFDFAEISRGIDHTHHLPPHYEAQILIRWGDAMFSDSPGFNPFAQSAEAQRRQFGANNDYIGFVPLTPERGQDERGLLCVNNEYTSTLLMFPDVGDEYPASVTAEQAATELAAHGGSIIEVARTGKQWEVIVPSPYNRRITADTTPMEVTGPAAGHERMKTSEDPSGRLVAGTMNNCAGGITPWGTYLMAEENINGCFMGELADDHPEAENHKRFGVPSKWYLWGQYVDRFDIGKEPNEPNRFGWVVEVDPLDPGSTPKKRTTLGRFKHEGAESVIAPDGRIVIYMGDDQRFDYVYKFVTDRPWDPKDPESGRDILDEGTLYVARFDADGSVAWLPLIFGQGPLTAENGFSSQGDVLISTRLAADLLGATPMDRPEDVEPDPKTGSVWVMLTNNHARSKDQVNAANPRAENWNGHIIQIIEPNGDFTSTQSRWDFLVRCGDPGNAQHMASWNPATSEDGWFGSPDNCAVDPAGRLWVATDGNTTTGAADGIWAMETSGAGRGTGKAFFRAPEGAEVCGPRFTPDGDTLFLAVQHPGDGSDATFLEPSTRWPDFEDGKPPRSAVLAIRRTDGGKIGG